MKIREVIRENSGSVYFTARPGIFKPITQSDNHMNVMKDAETVPGLEVYGPTDADTPRRILDFWQQHDEKTARWLAAAEIRKIKHGK